MGTSGSDAGCGPARKNRTADDQPVPGGFEGGGRNSMKLQAVPTNPNNSPLSAPHASNTLGSAGPCARADSNPATATAPTPSIVPVSKPATAAQQTDVRFVVSPTTRM